jgi:hypothetical protein
LTDDHERNNALCYRAKRKELNMFRTETPDDPCVLIEGARLGDANFYGAWLLAAAKLEAMWKTIQHEEQFLGLTCLAVPDLGAGAIEIMSSIKENCCIVGVVAEEFVDGALLTEIAMLTELGLLTPTGSRYQMTLPTTAPEVDDVRAAASKLPDPQDQGYSLERFITAMPRLKAVHWQRRLGVMDEGHRCADRDVLLGVTPGDIHEDRA